MSLSSIYYNNYRVVNLGAKPDGRTDSTKAFRSAWDKACASVNPAVIHVPARDVLARQCHLQRAMQQQRYHLSHRRRHPRFPIRLSGPWKCWYNWLLFQDVHGLNISSSHGILDGQHCLWDCKAH
ncbi:polygalacturonase-like [Prunus yedoensis var. nudiflora]|uniref:Polygalacturonase-like n=1 Tax=Prunus yedoensis var. nudiflora TaxID=2094558 RepID=A0A314UR68_PRUYE|nr:polygalacturonase-like [Prunus yedoensis var. nudiflora]